MTPNIRIHDLRLASGFRQTDLAEAVGCTAQVISNIERGVTDVSVDMAKKISEVLHVPLDEILQGEDNMNLSEDEVSMLTLYRQLTEKQKKLTVTIMNDLLNG